MADNLKQTSKRILTPIERFSEIFFPGGFSLAWYTGPAWLLDACTASWWPCSLR